MRLAQYLFASCVALSLAACAFAPPFDQPTPAMQLPEQWQTPLPHNGSITDLTRWWQDLGDPLLVDLLDAAQRSSPSLASLVELEDARRIRLAAADGLVLRQRERVQAWIGLYRAPGGGWTPAASSTQTQP